MWFTDACLYCCHVFSLPSFLPLSFLFVLSFLVSFLLLSSSHSYLSSLLYHLIPWDFFLLSLRLHQLFLVFCGHPIGYSATTSAQSMLAAPLPISRKNSLFCFLLSQFLSPSMDKDQVTSLLTSIACIKWPLPFTWLFQAKRYASKALPQKKPQQEPQNRLSFLSTTKPHPQNPLAGYQQMVLQPLCEFHYSLCLSSFTPTTILPFFPCLPLPHMLGLCLSPTV